MAVSFDNRPTMPSSPETTVSRRRTAGVFGVLLVACGACSGGAKSTSAPTATVPVSPPPPVHTLSGTVRANHVPVAGAIVVVRDVNGFYQDQTYATPPTELRTTTGADGRYSFSSVPEKISSPFGIMVRASNPGYFTDFNSPRSEPTPSSTSTWRRGCRFRRTRSSEGP